MSALEIIAIVGAIIVPVKILMLLRGQKFWFATVTARYWRDPVVTTVASLLAVVVLLYFLLEEMTIVEIWAGAIFGMALTSLALAPFSRWMLGVEKKWFTETNVLRTAWVPLVTWVILCGWVLFSLLS